MASRSTGRVDYTDKRTDYERFGILEYWRFDSSGGEYHDAALAGDLLVDGIYRPIAIETLQEGMLRGYSDALGLYVCWEGGRLRLLRPPYGELPQPLTTRPRLALKKSVSVVWRLKLALAPPRLVPELLRLVLKRNRQLVWQLKLALKKSTPVVWLLKPALAPPRLTLRKSEPVA